MFPKKLPINQIVGGGGVEQCPSVCDLQSPPDNNTLYPDCDVRSTEQLPQDPQQIIGTDISAVQRSRNLGFRE